MVTLPRVITASRLSWERYGGWKHDGVIITRANQLIASYNDFGIGRPDHGGYAGWEAHHVFEWNHIQLLGAEHKFPAYPLQPTVLLPAEAHRRVNSVLRRSIQTGMSPSPGMLVDAYADAYAILGDYSGGGERAIRDELMAIVETEMKLADVNI